jgi:hypothetical protein
MFMRHMLSKLFVKIYVLVWLLWIAFVASSMPLSSALRIFATVGGILLLGGCCWDCKHLNLLYSLSCVFLSF